MIRGGKKPRGFVRLAPREYLLCPLKSNGAVPLGTAPFAYPVRPSDPVSYFFFLAVELVFLVVELVFLAVELVFFAAVLVFF